MVHHNGKKLFEEDIEAWRYGPVVRNVYDQYKSFKGNPIDESINKSILNKFTLDSIEFIDGFLAEFIEHSAMSLVDMIHNEEPWEEAFDKNDPMPSNVISTDSMYRFYLEMLNKEIQLEKDEDAYYMKIIGERRKESTIPAEKVWSMIDVDN
jgi:uncharacterized phage-associated protein